MGIRTEVVPFLGVAILLGIVIALLCGLGHRSWFAAALVGAVPAAVLSAYFLYFFRDPPRTPPSDATAIVAGAEGTVARITELDHAAFLKAASFSGLNEQQAERFLTSPTITRISIFLSLFDVHVNRAPLSGTVEFLGYFPGSHVFTFKEKSSDVNQHNSILFHSEHTVCLVNQIVGPIARRVVYWPDPNRPVDIQAGDRIGMMKFGSRLDMYVPTRDIDITVAEGDRVRAGESMVARLRI